jgi:hypothetical protein
MGILPMRPAAKHGLEGRATFRKEFSVSKVTRSVSEGLCRKAPSTERLSPSLTLRVTFGNSFRTYPLLSWPDVP